MLRHNTGMGVAAGMLNGKKEGHRVGTQGKERGHKGVAENAKPTNSSLTEPFFFTSSARAPFENGDLQGPT